MLVAVGLGLLWMAFVAFGGGYGQPGNTAATYKVVGGTVGGALSLFVGLAQLIGF